MIKQFITLIPKHQPILLSYSGGLDSTVLLYQLVKFTKKYPFLKLRAIHINHQIHHNSELWSKHCEKICKKLNIQLLIKKIDINSKNNIQEKARKLRYQTIQKYIFHDEILLTAHHLDDQCETLFLSLKRGSGLDGLSGILHTNYFTSHQKIVRPLLKYSKYELKNWAQIHNITWIDDDSNVNSKYDRNFIRNKIIYKIKKKWPHFTKNCFRSMQILRNQTESLNQFLDNILHKYSISQDTLHLKSFDNIKVNTHILLIRRWIQLYKKIIISYKKTQEIYNHFINNNKNTNYRINFKTFEIRKYKNQIFQVPVYSSIKNTIIFWHNHHKPLQLPDKLGKIIQNPYGTKIIKPKDNDVINIRFQMNKKILINNHNKLIKNIFQEHNIPPWLRNRIPLLFYNNKLISIIGIFVIPEEKNTYIKSDYWKIAWINNYLKK